ncbi:hypothetical protein BH09VER1_BH09VER1_24540 [soil metagenome]
MAQLKTVTLRLALIQGSRDAITDKLSGKVPAIPRGNGVGLQCAVFTANPGSSTLVDDLSNIAAVSMQVRKTNALGIALFDKTVAIADFDAPGLTYADWLSDASQHFTVLLTAEETGQDLAGKDSLAIYIAFQAVPLVGDPIFLGSITTVIFEDGIGSSGDPIVGDPTYLTADESRAIFFGKALNMFTAEFADGSNFADIDITDAGLSVAPVAGIPGICKPNAGADDLSPASWVATSATSVRVYASAAAPTTGYIATILLK